jgi:hypothetical protein
MNHSKHHRGCICKSRSSEATLRRAAAAIFTAAVFVLGSLGVDSYGMSRPPTKQVIPLHTFLPQDASTSRKASAMKMGPMPVVAPLFVQDNDFTSTLHLVNDLNISTYADVVLTDLNGKEITRQRVVIGSHSQSSLEISALLLSSNSSATTGRIAVIQSPELQNITINSQLSMTYRGAKEPIYIDEEFGMPNAKGSQSLRAVTTAGKGSPLVGITSISETEQHMLIECFGAGNEHSSKSVQLDAGETLVTEACAERTLPGADFRTVLDSTGRTVRGPVAISLTSDALPGSFAAFGLNVDREHDARSFTTIEFSDPKMTVSPDIVFAGVPVGATPLLSNGKYIPQIALANFSDKSLSVEIKYAHTSGVAPTAADLENLVIPGRSTKHLSFDNLEGESNLQNSFLIKSNGQPGDLVAKLSSVTDSQPGEVQLQAKDEGDHNNGGVHPWSIENGNESTLLLFNHSSEPQHFNVHIGNNVVLWQKDFVLQPMETRSISFREMIETKAKDDYGKTLPETLASGQVGWFIPNHATGKGRLLLTNQDLGSARSFSCSVQVVICAGTGESFNMSNGYTETNNYAGLVIIWCQPSSSGCTGVPNGSTGTANYSWTTSVPSVASISGSSTGPNISLYGAGLGTSQINETAYDSSGCQQGGGGPAPVKIVAALVVPTTAFTVSVSSGSATFNPSVQVGATPAGYGAITFTVSVSGPSNPSGVNLQNGNAGAQGNCQASANGSCAAPVGGYNVSSTPTNTVSGTVTYTISGSTTDSNVSWSTQSKSGTVTFAP